MRSDGQDQGGSDVGGDATDGIQPFLKSALRFWDRARKFLRWSVYWEWIHNFWEEHQEGNYISILLKKNFYITNENKYR